MRLTFLTLSAAPLVAAFVFLTGTATTCRAEGVTPGTLTAVTEPAEVLAAEGSAVEPQHVPADCVLNSHGQCIPPDWLPKRTPGTALDLEAVLAAEAAESPCDATPTPRGGGTAASRFLELQARHRARGGDFSNWTPAMEEAMADFHREMGR
ncbi:MAG: hypothetical protein CTY28_09575 [Hyphomicrobium sp.]|nr:MAG: hypothetical protein CTY28_09575 [Hyphomicrobium sp.]